MKLKLRGKIFCLVSTILVVTLGLTGILNLINETDRIEQVFGEEAESLARTTAVAISAEMQTVANATGMQSSQDSLREIQNILWRIKSVNQLDANIKVFLTAWSGENDKSAPYLFSTRDGELRIQGDVLKPHIQKAIKSGTAGYLPLKQEKDGNWATGYAAVQDINKETGKTSTAGIVEVLIDTSSDFQMKKDAALKNTLFMLAWSTLGSLVFVFLFSSTLTRPIILLSEAMRQVSLGNLEQSAKSIIGRSDELGVLANSFESMMVDIRERDRMRVALHKYHGKAVTEVILNQEDSKTVGARKDVAVMFTDIRGFTRLSEGLPAEDVVVMLNEYFSAIVYAIYKADGVVDKFIGDGVMGIWGAPKSNPLDPVKAVQAALQIRKAVARLNDTRISRGQKPLYIGIGIHYGSAVAGNIGSAQKLEYTVVGDSINTASRIESATKVYGQDFIISESVANAVKNDFIVEELGSVAIEDKTAPLRLYKVLGTIDKNGKKEFITTPYSSYAMKSDSKIKPQVQYFPQGKA